MWSEINPPYDFQYKLFQNEETGEVVAVEMESEPWHADIEPPDISVYVLPPDFHENPEPEETIAHKIKSKTEAMDKARAYMMEAG